jgi:hypothetical protein
MRTTLIVALIHLFALLQVSCTTKNETENFRDFLVQFSSDVNFQKSRLKFPLEYVKLTEDFDKKHRIEIEDKRWEFENIFYSAGCSEMYPEVYDNFDLKLKDSGERVLAWKGIENGVAVFYYFKKINDKWFLVKKEDLST